MPNSSASISPSTPIRATAGCTSPEPLSASPSSSPPLALHHPWFALLWIPIAYGFAWTGHLLIEGNKPATFGHPFWSFLSDFRMIWWMTTGRLH